jgi:diguanylate cyclase (GGDEF)-like protein
VSELASEGLREFARDWARAVVDTSYVPMSRQEKTDFLYGLTKRLAGALAADPVDAAAAYQVGADLVRANFSAPEALGRTVRMITGSLAGTVRLAGDTTRPGDTTLLNDLVEALATGYARALRDRTLDEQESIRRAALLARERAEDALRDGEARFRHAASHDPLTGLPNRTLLTARLDQLFTDRASGARLGLCFLDLDGFKAVNDSLGHRVGDRLLAAVAGRLAARCAAQGCLVARLGGDEFAILVEDTTCADDAVKVADQALAALREPFRVDGHELPVTASVGVVERRLAGTDPTDLMRAADITLHWAKADGRDRWLLFDADRNAEEVARYRLSARLPAALARDEFVLEYQPLVGLAGGELRGFEALARWQHPRLGLVPPDQFIGPAEDTGLIVPLGLRLLEQACGQAAGWASLSAEPPYISVNLAARQARHPGLVGQVAAVLDRTGLPASRLQLEITENALVRTDDTSVGSLRALADLGVRIAIDDFGTGYANLAYLRALPVHELKLAAAFVRGLADETGGAVLSTLVTLGHALGLTVTAEGVETSAQAARLRAIACDTGQGWLFGRPRPADRAATMIRSH